MDLLNILHDIEFICHACGHVSFYGELLVSNTGNKSSNGREIFYVIGIPEGGESYSGERAKCQGCNRALDWLYIKKKEKGNSEIIQDVKDWLNKL